MHRSVRHRGLHTSGGSRRLPARSLLGALALALTGCMVGPSFQAPGAPGVEQYGPAPLPASFGSSGPSAETLQRLEPGRPLPERWWEAFGSATLNRRIETALAHNPSVDSARASLRQAQELLRASRGGRLPAVEAAAGASRLKPSVASGGGSSPYTLHNASVSVSYTLDLFGGVRQAVALREAQAEFQRWQLEGAALSLAANVATASIQEAALQEQIEAARQVVDLLQQQADLTAKQVALGARSQADLLAVQAQLASAQAALPPLELALASLRNQLAVLMGRFPSEGPGANAELQDYRLPATLPLSLPSDLVRRRPDVRAAEAQLQAATAQVGLATADLFPHITLGGAYGSSAYETSSLFKDATTTWSLGLNLLQPIFQGGSLRAMKRAAEAGLDGASATYRATVLNAFRGVSDALNALQLDADALAAQGAAEQAAARSLDLVKAQYRIGSASYLQLLDATRQWQQARAGTLRARSARLADTVALFAALGGGWPPPAAGPAPAAPATTP